MKTDLDKAKHFFRYNYYQWQTPRTLREAMRYSLVKAWRKQNSGEICLECPLKFWENVQKEFHIPL